ncbi:TPA: hypothetical protein ACE8UC_000378 [Neisseria gonorrhoeae]
MLLPDDIIKRMRAQTFGKRCVGFSDKQIGHNGSVNRFSDNMIIRQGKAACRIRIPPHRLY